MLPWSRFNDKGLPKPYASDLLEGEVMDKNLQQAQRISCRFMLGPTSCVLLPFLVSLVVSPGTVEFCVASRLKMHV